MKTIATLSLTMLLAAAAHAQGGGRGGGEPTKPVEQPKCDVAKLEKAKYCETCVAIKEKDDLSDGWTCKTCTQKVKEVDCCVKEGFECPKCKATAAKEGSCAAEECKKEKTKLAKRIFKCRIIWRCKGSCLQTSPEKKACPQKECSSKGKDFEKSCEMSGREPHVKKK